MNEQNRNQTKITSVGSNPSPTPLHERSIPVLIKELANDVTGLFTKEVALAKSELTRSVSHFKTGIMSVLSGGSVLFAGFLFLLLSGVIGLSQVVELWLASLIVGGVVTLIGLIMVQAGKKKLEASSLTPHHTIHSLQKDRNTIARETTHVQETMRTREVTQ